MRKNIIWMIFILLFYLIISALYFCGKNCFQHFNSYYVGFEKDPIAFIWFFQWWPTAIFQLKINPFISHYLWSSSSGLNLLRATSIPFLAMLFSPITFFWEAIASYNLVILLAPALSAFSAFICCRYISKSNITGLICGYIYGFSPYIIAHMMPGHVNLVSVYFIPLGVFCFLLFADNKISTKACIGFIVLLLILQFLVSSEIYFSSILFGGIFLLMSALLNRNSENYSFSIHTFNVFVFSALLSFLPLLPLVQIFLNHSSGASMVGAGFSAIYSNDLLSLIVPSPLLGVNLEWLRHVSMHYLSRTNLGELSGYFGIPFVVISILVIRKIWSRKMLRPLAIMFLLMILFSLGPVMKVYGFSIFKFPYYFLYDFFPFSYLLPGRFSNYYFLMLSIFVALWLKDGGHLRKKYFVVIFALIFWIPTFSSLRILETKIPAIQFFQENTYKTWIKQNEVVLFIPYYKNGISLYYQAQSKMYFRLSDGYAGGIPPSFLKKAFVYLAENTPSKMTEKEFKSFVKENTITKIIVMNDEMPRWGKFFDSLGYAKHSVDDVVVYLVR